MTGAEHWPVLAYTQTDEYQEEVSRIREDAATRRAARLARANLRVRRVR